MPARSGPGRAAPGSPGVPPPGRLVIAGVCPVVDCGRWPAKSVVGEEFPVLATVVAEERSSLGAAVVLTAPDGSRSAVPMLRTDPDLDTWSATVSGWRTGRWRFRVEGWLDPYATWRSRALREVAAGADADLTLREGAAVLERALREVRRSPDGGGVLADAAGLLRDAGRSPAARLAAGTSDRVRQELRAGPLRDHLTATADHPWVVERERALYGAWYEIFPRSEGARYDGRTGRWTSGTLRTAARRLPAIAAMGFDVVYLTPIHPIGRTNRKGPNNSLRAGEHDPGSPYAIGSAAGGHDAIHPDLGTFADFDALVASASRLGLEVALDLALQCSPDHPWVTEHPEWFTWRPDGSIAYAENPPKKYEDVYPLDYDKDPRGLSAEIRRVVQVWLDHGVRIFRVDNPHTKPARLWEWLIADVARDHPDVIWLAEAVTGTAMMRMLAKVGFQQSYTYFTWTHTKERFERYCRETFGPAAAYLRPSHWPSTHDSLSHYLQQGGRGAWKVRAALAATLAPTWGVCAGYELVEDVGKPGTQEPLDSEKYQFRDRRWEDYEPGGPHEGRSLAPYLRRLNEIRRDHPALHWLRNVSFHRADSDDFVAYSKRRSTSSGDDVVLVVANLDPGASRDTRVHLDMPRLGLDRQDTVEVQDLVTWQSWRWGEHNVVRLGGDAEPVHILQLRRP